MLDVGPDHPNARATTSLNIAPLMDVMLLLLIFFLLASAFVRPAFDVDLPGAAHSRLASERKQQIIISLTREGLVFVDGVPVPLPELKGKLEAALAQDRERPILLQADKKSAFGNFIAVMDAAKGAAAVQLIIETRTAPTGDSDGR